jgi:MFS family permease
LLHFAGLGAGLVLTLFAIVPRLVALLGHPASGLSVVAAGLLLAIAVGGCLTGSITSNRIALAAGRRAQLLVALLALVAVAAGPGLDAAAGLPFGARLALVVVVLAPFGALMGALLPLGFTLVAARSPELLPWCWGLAGAAGVIALGAGALLALAFGYNAVFLAAGASYLLAAANIPKVKGAAYI